MVAPTPEVANNLELPQFDGESVDSVDVLLTSCQRSQTFTDKGFEGFVDVVDAILLNADNHASRSTTSDHLGEVVDESSENRQQRQQNSVTLSGYGIEGVDTLSANVNTVNGGTPEAPNETKPSGIPQHPASEATEVDAIAVPETTFLPETSQQMHLDLSSVSKPAVELVLPPNVEWVEPESSDYQEQCQAIASAPLIALDIETFQSDKPKRNVTPKALHPWQSGLRLVQLCVGDRTFLIDFGDRYNDFEATLTRHQPTIELLHQVIQNPEQRIVGHNVHFDLRFLATKFGIRNAKNIVCTMIGAQVYYGDYGSAEGQTAKGKHEPILAGGYSLANLAKQLLDTTLDKDEQKSDFGAELTTEQIIYATKDPQVTLQVYKALEILYNDTSKVLYSSTLLDCWKLECDVIPAAIEIEMVGLPLDIEDAQQQLTTIEAHKKKLLEDWVNLCPNLKYTQRDKLLNHLNQEYNLGLAKLNKGSLNKQSRENPLIEIKLKIQGLDAQANNLRGFLNSATRDGRVHTTYKTLTGFGRFSSGGGTPDLPNLQSIKAKSNPILKEFDLPDVRAVIRPAPGRTMAVIDLAGAHGRIAASETQDETAIAGNNDDTVDNHSKVAVFIAKAQGLSWTWEQISELRKQRTADGVKAKLFRDTAKNTYYGWLNGAGWQRIQQQITSNTGVTPTETECRAAIEGCKALYPGVLKHRNELMKHLAKTSISLPDGRQIVVNKIRDGFRFCMSMVVNEKYPERGLQVPYTQSLACIWSRIEATAVKRALIQIMSLREQHPEWHLEVINYVHDEIDIEVDSVFVSVAVPLVNDIIGNCFAALLNRVNDGRETDWRKLIVKSWADK